MQNIKNNFMILLMISRSYMSFEKKIGKNKIKFLTQSCGLIKVI